MHNEKTYCRYTPTRWGNAQVCLCDRCGVWECYPWAASWYCRCQGHSRVSFRSSLYGDAMAGTWTCDLGAYRADALVVARCPSPSTHVTESARRLRTARSAHLFCPLAIC